MHARRDLALHWGMRHAHTALALNCLHQFWAPMPYHNMRLQCICFTPKSTMCSATQCVRSPAYCFSSLLTLRTPTPHAWIAPGNRNCFMLIRRTLSDAVLSNIALQALASAPKSSEATLRTGTCAIMQLRYLLRGVQGCMSCRPHRGHGDVGLVSAPDTNATSLQLNPSSAARFASSLTQPLSVHTSTTPGSLSPANFNAALGCFGKYLIT